MDFSGEIHLPANTIEKDYVLGWLLAGIANHPKLFDQWIFKGGTCLKKCYFETFRFSEDLDYTLKNANQIDEVFLTDCFKSIGKWIYETAGIEILENTIRFDIYKNNDGKTSVEGCLNYIGPLQRRNNAYRIKLDLTADELLATSPVLRDVYHPYSDKPSRGMQAYCYSFPEIFAEKMRALSERARPRDLYDVVHLYKHATSTENPSEILEALKMKCEYKAIPVPTMESLEKHPKRHELRSEWESMLAHQISTLPPMEQFWQELPRVFEWLCGAPIKTAS